MNYQLVGIVGESLRKWPLPEGEAKVGRSTEVAISVPDRSVSREHARLRRDGDALVVEDLQSRNGTSVNGTRLRGPQLLQPGDQVAFGNVVLTVVSEEQPLQPSLSDHTRLDSTVKLAWNDVRSVQPAAKAETPAALFDVMATLGEFLVRHQPAQEIYDACLETIEKLVPFQRACLLLLDENGEPVLKAARYKSGPSNLALALSRTMVATVIQERASLLVQDAFSDPRFGAAQSVIMEQIRSALIAPLFDNTRVIGVLYADTRELVSPYTREHLRQLALLANILAVKITNARLLDVEEEKRVMEQEIATAARIQRALLVQDLPCPAGYELVARLEPSAAVGGDLYDVLELPGGRYALVLGDVVGHGVGAALLMANALAAVRALAAELPDPVELVERVHAQIYSTTDSTSYLTLFYAVLDPRSHSLEYVNAAQEAPALLRAGAPAVRLESTGPPVGLLQGSTFSSARADVAPGALLCAWSDGITEAHVPQDDDTPVFFGEAHSLLGLCAEHPSEPLTATADRIFDEVDRFLHGGKAPDDRTLLLLRRA
jgi:serine phosphatase RsbU (regulator of sigma subunit)/pSer/pThr/pTyr-binding forkhead associated (FHA) protein